MLQAADVLVCHYPEDFTKNDLEEHVDDLLQRFQNRALQDTVFRVGRDLPRKLGIDDRFAGIIRMARQQGLPYDRIAGAMAYGFFFEKTDENGRRDPRDEVFLETLQVEGVEKTLMMLCGFRCEKDAYLMHELKDRYNELKTKREQ
jgi:mannitol-1-phosphate 5-dehydrogenase